MDIPVHSFVIGRYIGTDILSRDYNMTRLSAASPGRIEFEFVFDAFRAQAACRPDAVALIDERGESHSYRELAQRADALAAKLADAGVGPERCVAVWMRRSPELFVAMLAVMQAGGAYLPIDPGYPDARVRQLLAHAQPTVMITDSGRTDELGVAGLTVVWPAAGDAPAASAAARRPPLAPGHLAYVIYTSGSTGEPKAVAMSHRSLTRLIRWQIGDGDAAPTTLQFTPVCFDVSFQEVFSTLCTGGCLVLVADDTRRDPERLLRFLQARKVERIFLPYVALQQLAKTAQAIDDWPRTLRHVITAGERLLVTDAIRRFFAEIPGCRLDNHYGPSETHLVSSWTLDREPDGWPLLPPIGTAVGGVEVRVLDEALAPVARGEIGELHVGGAAVARGYLGAPVLSAEHFLPDPSGAPGATMYRTGDLVRMTDGGVLEFVGRADAQIKVRGFRVEPAEVQRALLDVAGVREASVGLRAVSGDVEVLAAYVVANGAAADGGELGRVLRERLPDYMVPACFVFVDALPISPTGKVDLRQLAALPLPEIDVPAGGTMLDVVRRIWERVLGHAELESDDDFFDVGGDSLLATWVVSELSRVLDRQIDLSLLLKDSTMAGIAGTLEAMRFAPAAPRSASEVITLRAGPSQRALFLVHPLGGELLAYRELAQSIRSPLRVLGLRWQPEHRRADGVASLRDLASEHVAQLQLVHPGGPYLLAGWSFGGVLAMEIAQQLTEAGLQVDFIGMIDANPVIDPTSGELTAQSPLRGRLAAALDRMEAERARGDIVSLPSDASLLALLGNTIPEGVTAEHLQRNLRVTHDSLQAAMEYRPRPYVGRIDLFQPAEAPEERRDRLARSLGEWVRGALHVHTVSGDHYAMMRAPHVAGIGAAIDDVLSSINAH